MPWNDFPICCCAQPSRVGRFLLVMADAYLCAMPMTYEMISQTPYNSHHTYSGSTDISSSATRLSFDAEFQSVPYYGMITISNAIIDLTCLSVSSGSMSNVSACVYIQITSSDTIYGENVSFTFQYGLTRQLNMPAVSYTGIFPNPLTIGIYLTSILPVQMTYNYSYDYFGWYRA